MGWLFGALAEAGIELPDTFDLKGIVKLLASIFGLTWANIRNRIVKQIGEKAMGGGREGRRDLPDHREPGRRRPVADAVEKLGDIKEMILEQVKDFVITKIITAGITWLISLLNPAAAFIKACKLIYDVVMFFVEQRRADHEVRQHRPRLGRRHRRAATSAASSSKIERRARPDGADPHRLPASVLGLGGIGEKIREIIQTLQKPVNKALDFVIKTGPEARRPDHPRPQGHRRQGQGARSRRARPG